MTKKEESEFNFSIYSGGMQRKLQHIACSRCGKPNPNYREPHEKEGL